MKTACRFFDRHFPSPRFAHIAMLILSASLAGVPLLHAQKLTLLHAFAGMPDGVGPVAAPIHDKQGNLYSTTYAGGTSDWGTVYKIDPQGHETVLHSFTGGTDGITPESGLVMDAQGNLYGTTYWGGSTNCFHTYGCGVVYELSPGSNGWKETILYVFQGGSDGAYPEYGTLVRDAKGSLYGTTAYGGSASWPNGNGVVFKLSKSSGGWKEQVYAFGSNAPSDGANPYGGVTLDAAGNIYGTTYYGGTEGNGTVFKITASGTESVLYSFTGGTDGADPMAAPVLDPTGNLYGGTTFAGDPNCSCGTIYKVDPTGVETVLHTFTGYPNDGASPHAPLLRDNSGNLYGTTYYGGNSKSADCTDNNQPIGCGTVFQMAPSGKERILNLNYQTEGGQVYAGVAFYAGALYGATSSGGSRGDGVVFKISK